MNLIGSDLGMPGCFSVSSIHRDEFAGKVCRVNAILDQDGRAGEADVIVIAPSFRIGSENDLLCGILGGDVQADEAALGS